MKWQSFVPSRDNSLKAYHCFPALLLLYCQTLGLIFKKIVIIILYCPNRAMDLVDINEVDEVVVPLVNELKDVEI